MVRSHKELSVNLNELYISALRKSLPDVTVKSRLLRLQREHLSM